MAFTATRIPSATTQTFDTTSGNISIGGGVASAPTTGAELLNLINRWCQSQPDLNGKEVTAEVSPSGVFVLVSNPAPPGAVVQPRTRPVIVATFIANKPAIGGGSDPTPYQYFVSDGSGQVIGMKAGAGLGDLGNPAKVQGAMGLWAEILDGNAPRFLTFYSAKFVNGQYVITSWLSDSQQVIARSADGITWTATVTTQFQCGFYTFAYGAGLLVGVDKDRTAGVSRSADMGVNWTKDTTAFPNVSGFANNPLCIEHNGTVFCVLAKHATAGGGIYSYTSADGITWGSRTLTPVNTGTSTNWATNPKFIRHKDKFIFLTTQQGGVPGTWVMRGDGATWALASLPYDASETPVSNGTNILVVSFLNGSQVMVSEDDGATFTAHATGAASSFDKCVWNGTKFVLYSDSDATRRYTSPDGIVWTEETFDSVGVVVTPGDITDANNGGGPVSFFSAAGLDPAYLTAGVTPVASAWPATPPTSYVQGVFNNRPWASAYITISFNGRFYNFATGTWQDVLTSQCRLIPPAGAGMTWFFDQMKLIWSASVSPSTLFVSSYTNGRLSGVDLITAAQSNPAYLELRSGTQYLNFTTGQLQAGSGAMTWMLPAGPFATFGTEVDTWFIYAADMPILAPGLEPYTPPAALSPVTVGGDYVATPDGYVVAPANPFTFQAAAGMNLSTAPPTLREFQAGFSEYTATPLPFSSRGGFLEQTSPTTVRVANSATTLHMGVPITVEG